ncbi:hypothetical protein [Flavobacterium sp.]|uniref:hypothetical protein n=1 Tax=Flavobacterium sp. TaxID=239 RepID=UPI00260704C0|nr:hypothetical protein [Flavobacterium sp.]
MKKISLFSLLFLSLFFVQCSSDDSSSSSSGTLFVNDVLFKIGTNALPNTIYNLTMFYGDDDPEFFNTRTFNILDPDSSTETNYKNITIVVAYPGLTSINGTYSLLQEDNLDGIPFASVTFETASDSYGGDVDTSTGSLKVTDMGSNKFKLEFIDVTVENESGDVKTITGYCTPTFTSLN